MSKAAVAVASYEDETPDYKRSRHVGVSFALNLVDNKWKATLTGNGKVWIGEGNEPSEALENAQKEFKANVEVQIKKVKDTAKEQLNKLQFVARM